jgi:hypothetical protein
LPVSWPNGRPDRCRYAVIRCLIAMCCDQVEARTLCETRGRSV